MVDPKLARAYGTLAGFGFLGVAVLGLPSTMLLEPEPEPSAYLLTLVGALSGLLCLALPWERLDPRWLHLVGIVAIAEAAAAVVVFGQAYVVFFFLIAVFVAYFAPDGKVLALHLGLICVALFGPVVYGPESARTALSVALVTAPVLLLTAGLFAYLRQKMVHDRRAYHRFAEQTLVLSTQIAGRPVAPSRAISRPEPAPPLADVRPPRPVVAVAAALVGIPLFAGSLAAAGVTLPELANGPFEEVGIDLPNQEDEERSEAPESGPAPAAAPEAAQPGKEPSRAVQRDDAAGPSPGDAQAGAPAPGTGEQPPAAPEAPQPAPTEPGASDPQAEPPAGEPSPTPLKDLLDGATDGLEGLFGGSDR
jgi:hypothetical protein